MERERKNVILEHGKGRNRKGNLNVRIQGTGKQGKQRDGRNRTAMQSSGPLSTSKEVLR